MDVNPEALLEKGVEALALGRWDQASAYGSVGMLSLSIGAMKAVVKLGDQNAQEK